MLNINSIKSKFFNKNNIFLSAMIILFAGNSVLADFKNIPQVERKSENQIEIKWENKNPVSVYLSNSPETGLNNAKLLLSKSMQNNLIIDSDKKQRIFIILKDNKDSEIIKSSERLINLEMGSNFRDIGGYKTNNGKFVKWGKIYRTGATSMLNESDLEIVKSLKIKELIDLRSIEERVLAPTKINHVNYNSYGYEMMGMLPKQSTGTIQNGVDLYRNFPKFFAPQVKIVFNNLLKEGNTIVYNCSAGQDRTGFVTAVILASLGVKKETIIEDYLLSTKYRKPVNEFPKIDTQLHKDNKVALLFAKYQAMPNFNVPTPLVNEEGKAFLMGALEEIDTKWGSVENYLVKEVGITAAEINKIKLMYLE